MDQKVEASILAPSSDEIFTPDLGDSAYSTRSSHRSLRLLGRALSTNLTLNSDGSSSTILLEDWRPIFDKFDREVDGKQVKY